MSRFVPLAAALRDAKVFNDGDWVESKDQDQNGEVRLTQLADVGDGYWINKSNRFMTHEKAARLKCTFLEPGDVLVARMPEPLGRSCIFPGDTKPCVTVVDVCVMRPNNEILDSRYLMHAINSPFSRHGIAQHITGTTRKRISRRNLGKVTIFLPPLPEQKHIAAILDAADSLRVKRRESIEQLDSLIQSTFLEMFGDPVTNPKGWETVSLESICERIVDCPHSTPVYSDEDTEYFCVRSSDIQNGVLELSEARHVSEDTYLERISRYTPRGGEVVYTREGGRLGFAGLVPPRKRICLGQRMMLFKSSPESALNCYIWGYLNSRSVHSMVINMSGGGAAPRVNIKQLKNLKTTLPPLDLQTRFASIVESIEHQKTLLKSHLAELDTLFASLQSRAFSGELVA